MADFRFFKIAAVRHLVLRAFRPPTKSICWSLSLCKFSWNRCSSFDNMPVLMFCEVELENAYTRPFWVVYWGIWFHRWASQVYLLRLTPGRQADLTLLDQVPATVTVYRGHRRTLFFPARDYLPVHHMRIILWKADAPGPSRTPVIECAML